MSPVYVWPCVEVQKNDDLDGKEATRPTLRFGALKSEKQLDVRTLHRVGDRVVGDRGSLTNPIGSLLLRRGHVMAQGHARLRLVLGELLEGSAGWLSPRMALLLGELRTRREALDRRISAFDAEFAPLPRPTTGCAD